jgi:hypothetical protein
MHSDPLISNPTSPLPATLEIKTGLIVGLLTHGTLKGRSRIDVRDRRLCARKHLFDRQYLQPGVPLASQFVEGPVTAKLCKLAIWNIYRTAIGLPAALTARALRTCARRSGYNELCAWDRDARDNPG